MHRIKVNHYKDLVIYAIEQVIKNLNQDIAQYISTLNLNITAEQLLVLDTIYCCDNICQQDIAKILSKDKSNIKRIVEILEKNGLITREAGKKNNRLVNYLSITNEGKELIDNNIDKIKDYMEKLFEPVTEEEEQVLKNIIKRLNSVRNQ